MCSHPENDAVAAAAAVLSTIMFTDALCCAGIIKRGVRQTEA